MRMSTSLLALIGIVIASVFWASSGAVAKILFSSFDPYTISFLRTAVASIILIPIFLKKNTHPIREVFRDVVPVGLAFTLNFFCFYVGVSKTTANASAIIYVGVPLVAALIAHFWIHEKTSVIKWIGIIIGLSGSILVLVLPALEKGKAISGNLEGNLYIAGAVLSWAMYTIGSRRVSQQHHSSPIIFTAVSTIVCASVFFVLVLATPHATPIIPALLTGPHIGWFLYLGIFVTIVTNYLFQWAIKHSSTMTATLTHYLQPIFAFVFNSFLGEQLSAGMIIGSVIIMFGVFLASSARATAYVRNFRARRRS
jgi:drug/metabolite transporter (DMT)-like permease